MRQRRKWALLPNFEPRIAAKACKYVWHDSRYHPHAGAISAQRAGLLKRMKQANIDAAKSILAQQGETKKWGAEEHLAMLANLALAAFEQEQGPITDPDERKAVKRALRVALRDDGVSGNASQFRQGLAKLDLIPKSAEATLAQYE